MDRIIMKPTTKGEGKCMRWGEITQLWSAKFSFFYRVRMFLLRLELFSTFELTNSKLLYKSHGT